MLMYFVILSKSELGVSNRKKEWGAFKGITRSYSLHTHPSPPKDSSLYILILGILSWNRIYTGSDPPFKL